MGRRAQRERRRAREAVEAAAQERAAAVHAELTRELREAAADEGDTPD